MNVFSNVDLMIKMIKGGGTTQMQETIKEVCNRSLMHVNKQFDYNTSDLGNSLISCVEEYVLMGFLFIKGGQTT